MTSSVWAQQRIVKPVSIQWNVELALWPGPVFAHDEGKDKRNLFTITDADYAAEPF
ncbi:MAG: hypothetical protein ACFFEE_01005 [Candidatus Thorarchaeota archaeon]